ncbi:MAG TPA: hypothetical protein VNJ08_11225 [Bacteriovoracaceae bacterium]|nr:hypothetical protein [Bacteriovoracaceae bacterium]
MMGKSPLFKFFFALVILTPGAGWATLDFEDHAFPEFVTSARALALGNAYICKVDDSWSAFYNPAGLGTVRGINLHLANVHVEASNGLLKAVGGGPATEFPGKYMDSYDPNLMRAALSEHQGKLAHSRFNLFPNITVKGMTLGYLYSQRNRSIINDDVANKYEIAERKDHGPVFALNASLFGGILKFGASAVYLIRRDLYDSFDPTEVVVINDLDYRYGKSLQITGGTKLTLPFNFLPTFAAVIRNATANDFEAADLGGLPVEIKQTIDVGFSITPQLGKVTRLHMEVNLKDTRNVYDTDINRRIAAGVELDFNRRIFLRGGYGDGWGSGGLGVRSRKFIMDLTTYAVDRSLDGFRQEQDRRWVFSVSSGF